MSRCWLIKSEPEVYSIDDLARDGSTCWEGVRNYQARNSMRDDMKVGDRVLFYHSNTDPVGVAGVAEIVGEATPDPFALDASSHYHDPKASPDTNPWVMVDVGFVSKLPRVVTLAELKADPALDGMLVTRRGMRLSVQPVEAAHFDHVVALGNASAD